MQRQEENMLAELLDFLSDDVRAGGPRIVPGNNEEEKKRGETWGNRIPPPRSAVGRNTATKHHSLPLLDGYQKHGGSHTLCQLQGDKTAGVPSLSLFFCDHGPLNGGATNKEAQTVSSSGGLFGKRDKNKDNREPNNNTVVSSDGHQAYAKNATLCHQVRRHAEDNQCIITSGGVPPHLVQGHLIVKSCMPFEKNDIFATSISDAASKDQERSAVASKRSENLPMWKQQLLQKEVNTPNHPLIKKSRMSGFPTFDKATSAIVSSSSQADMETTTVGCGVMANRYHGKPDSDRVEGHDDLSSFNVRYLSRDVQENQAWSGGDKPLNLSRESSNMPSTEVLFPMQSKEEILLESMVPSLEVHQDHEVVPMVDAHELPFVLKGSGSCCQMQEQSNKSDFQARRQNFTLYLEDYNDHAPRPFHPEIGRPITVTVASRFEPNGDFSHVYQRNVGTLPEPKLQTSDQPSFKSLMLAKGNRAQRLPSSFLTSENRILPGINDFSISRFHNKSPRDQMSVPRHAKSIDELVENSMGNSGTILVRPQQEEEAGHCHANHWRISRPATPTVKPLNAYNYFFVEMRHGILQLSKSDRERLLGARHHLTQNSDNDSKNCPDYQPGLLANVIIMKQNAIFSEAERKRWLISLHLRKDRSSKRKHRKKHGKISFTQMNKIVSSEWNHLSLENKTFYDAVAEIDKKRYHKEKCQW